MSTAAVVDLAECSEFRQTLAARPPRVVHGTALLLVGLLLAAIIWAAIVEANLVVKAAGRVRTVETPTRIFTSASADLEGRVIEAPFEEGDIVRQGDVLVRLDTAHIDNRIAKLERTLESSQEELALLTALEQLLVLQLASSKEKARAELAQAEGTLALAVGRRASEVRRAQADLDAAKDLVQRHRKLRESRASSEEQLVKAGTEFRQAQEILVQAQLPVDAAPVDVAHRAAEVIDREFAVRQAELQARKVVKQGEVEAARRDLATLNMQRKEAVLRSPIDGVVVAGRVRPGDVLEPGKPVLEIARQQSYCFEALVAGGDIGNLGVGMPVNIKFDAYDYQKYGALSGKVVYLSPDSMVPDHGDGGTDTKDGTTSRRSPPAFVVRIELGGDEVGRGELRGRIKLGLGGTAEIVTEQETLLKVLFKKLGHTISLG